MTESVVRRETESAALDHLTRNTSLLKIVSSSGTDRCGERFLEKATRISTRWRQSSMRCRWPSSSVGAPADDEEPDWLRNSIPARCEPFYRTSGKNLQELPFLNPVEHIAFRLTAKTVVTAPLWADVKLQVSSHYGTGRALKVRHVFCRVTVSLINSTRSTRSLIASMTSRS